MKRLYYCTAKYDEDHLQSYDTMIVEKRNNIIWFRNYYSVTTRRHIRKYIDKMAQYKHYSIALKILYDETSRNGRLKDAYGIIFNLANGHIKPLDYNQWQNRYTIPEGF